MSNYRAISISLVFIVVIAAVLTPSSSGDTWALPKKQKYYSQNKKFYLEVVPKKLESQLKYFEDKVKNRENAGARPDVKDNQAKGFVYARRPDGSYFQKSKFLLVNEVSPVSAIISNDGEYLVTFDNWHSMGYGDDVIVLYRSDGSLIKKFGLGDLLTEGDIKTLPHSVSSIWWGGDHYIDESAGLLVLKIVSNRKSPWEEGVHFRDLKIGLADGRTLEAKRDLFPQPRVFVSVEAQNANIAADPGKPICVAEGTFDPKSAVQISSEQMLAKAKEHPLPPFPPIAKAAHVEGVVVIQILASGDGSIICARSLSGHPLLRAAATSAVLQWRFEPFEPDVQSAPVIGTMAISFKITENVPTAN